MGESNLINTVLHYQQCLEKYSKRNDITKMLYCIQRLYKMPVTVGHLEKTGVGRTVNALRKLNGDVGDAAKSLVLKWKEMVEAIHDKEEDEIDISTTVKEEPIDKYPERSSSHRETEHNPKQEKKEKCSTSSSREKADSSKHEKRESKQKKHDESKRDVESKHHKHKSSHNKHESDDSDIEKMNKLKSHKESKRKHASEDSDAEKSIKKHTSSKPKRIEVSSSESEMEYTSSKHKKSVKRKLSDSDSESDNKYKTKVKHTKYSDDEIAAPVKHYSKHHHSSQSSVTKEKSKDRDKLKEKKEKKEKHVQDKSAKDLDNCKEKEKNTHKDRHKSSSEKKDKESKHTEKKSKSSKHSNKELKLNKNSSSSSIQPSHSMTENGIGSESGTSFAEALGMLAPISSKSPKKKPIVNTFIPESDSSSSPIDVQQVEVLNILKEKKLPPLDISVANLLPEITPNYRPLGNFPLDNGPSKLKTAAEDEALIAIMNSKISRTKVYSGNKVTWSTVPSLFDLCTHVLQDNIDALEYTGGVPYSILKPVLERATPDQLFTLENHNPYLIEDTDELWRLHCGKEFRPKRREEMESWRDMYMRCLDEREAKLRLLTANIKQSQDKSLPVRQTKLAYVDSVVKPPRTVARKQAKHGTGGATGGGSDKKPLITPSHRLTTLATSGAAGQIAVPNPGARASSSSGGSSGVQKIKKAPLMQKTLAFMKNRAFRR